MIRSDLHAECCEDLLQDALATAETPLWLINPTWRTLSQFLSLYRDSPPVSPPPSVRLFAGREQLRRLSEDFLLAGVAAELVADETLKLRRLQRTARQSLLLTEHAAVSLVECEDAVAGLTTTHDGFVRTAYQQYTTRWDDADPFPLRTPPLSETRSTLKTEMGPGVLDDFDRALEILRNDHGREDTPLDEVTLILLVGAANGELLYDISRWGEEISLASKATFSRTKNELEDAGLIDTEKVPIEVGRPRLRLVPDGGSPHEVEIEALTRQARATLG